MVRRIFAFVLLALYLTLHVQPVSAASTPKVPGASPLPCVWQGEVYPHGAVRAVALIGATGKVFRYDYYRCQDAKWYYFASSDDIN